MPMNPSKRRLPTRKNFQKTITRDMKLPFSMSFDAEKFLREMLWYMRSNPPSDSFKKMYFSKLLKISEGLEDVNDHTANAYLLAIVFGTPEEMTRMRQIADRHERDGEIQYEDQRWRDKNVLSKYQARLERMAEREKFKQFSWDKKPVNPPATYKVYEPNRIPLMPASKKLRKRQD